MEGRGGEKEHDDNEQQQQQQQQHVPQGTSSPVVQEARGAPYAGADKGERQQGEEAEGKEEEEAAALQHGLMMMLALEREDAGSGRAEEKAGRRVFQARPRLCFGYEGEPRK